MKYELVADHASFVADKLTALREQGRMVETPDGQPIMSAPFMLGDGSRVGVFVLVADDYCDDLSALATSLGADGVVAPS